MALQLKQSETIIVGADDEVECTFTTLPKSSSLHKRKNGKYYLQTFTPLYTLPVPSNVYLTRKYEKQYTADIPNHEMRINKAIKRRQLRQQQMKEKERKKRLKLLLRQQKQNLDEIKTAFNKQRFVKYSKSSSLLQTQFCIQPRCNASTQTFNNLIHDLPDIKFLNE